MPSTCSYTAYDMWALLALCGVTLAWGLIMYLKWIGLYLDHKRLIDFHHYTIYRQGQPPEVH
jgi:hypothetical protein